MSQTINRNLLLALLFLFSSVLSTAPVANAQDCAYPNDAPGGAIVAEAYNVLASLYVEPMPPSTLLAAAAEAVRGEVARVGNAAALVPDPPKSFGDDASAVARFAIYYCQVLDVAPNGTDPQAVAYAGVRAMTSTLNEAHTRFQTPSMYQSYQASLSGDDRYEGIGARLGSNPLAIEYVFPGSPAQDAGVRPGDQVLAINGQPSTDWNAQDAVTQVRGDAGTTVTLLVRRPGVADPITFAIVRAAIRIPLVEADIVEDIGILRLRSFPSTPLDQDVNAQLERFNAAGTRALILDLRGNPGGRLDVGRRTANLFLPDGAPIWRQTTRAGRTTERASSGGPVWTKPLVVLIDSGTASMGEILAAALKEQAGATLIGATTAGAVAGSIVVPLSDGSAVQVTTLRIDSSRGTVLNVIGLRPDIAIPTPEGAARGTTDTVMDAAMAHLRNAPRAGADVTPLPEDALPVAA